MKFNFQGNCKAYEENAEKFMKISKIASDFVKYILEKANLSTDIVDCLMEHKEIRDLHDLYDLFQVYNNTENERVKYEILRRLGLIVLVSRINRSQYIDDIDFNLDNVQKIVNSGFNLSDSVAKTCYVLIDEKNKVNCTNDFKEAEKLHLIASNERKKRALKFYPLQKITYSPSKTFQGNEILNFKIRHKLIKDDKLNYNSFMEKMIRKSLEFPNQVHDVIGLKIVAKDEESIVKLISELESFLGGTSTRKKEKNTLNKFGKKRLSMYSSKDYFVWKAIYDIALPNPSINSIKTMLNLTRGNKFAWEELLKRLEYFKEHPKDFVVEVQLQDFNSYLLSIAKGSSTYHGNLKVNQIRSNSFYKVFPKEIYDKELLRLRGEILGV